MRKDIIKNPKNIGKYKIHQLQLDPFGVCNARCWFCPVRYKGNPKEGKSIMSIELLEKIIKNLIDERSNPNGLVHPSFGSFYTAHYNEILLYPHFEELLEICEKYGINFMILSNGLGLTPEKVDLINKHKGAINSIYLNIPVFERELWSKRVGVNVNMFDKLISNIKYASEQLYYLTRTKSFGLQINGVTENSLIENGGWLTRGKDFPIDMDLNIVDGEMKTQEKIANELFPNLKIFTQSGLIDRVGMLDAVMTNKPSIKQWLQQNDETKKVIGCSHGVDIGGRPIGWLHVNANGDAFLCCNDYDFEYKFGNFKTQQLNEFWGTDEHIKKIEHAYDTICRSCASAIFE